MFFSQTFDVTLRYNGSILHIKMT